MLGTLIPNGPRLAVSRSYKVRGADISMSEDGQYLVIDPESMEPGPITFKIEEVKDE